MCTHLAHMLIHILPYHYRNFTSCVTSLQSPPLPPSSLRTPRPRSSRPPTPPSGSQRQPLPRPPQPLESLSGSTGSPPPGQVPPLFSPSRPDGPLVLIGHRPAYVPLREGLEGLWRESFQCSGGKPVSPDWGSIQHADDAITTCYDTRCPDCPYGCMFVCVSSGDQDGTSPPCPEQEVR